MRCPVPTRSRFLPDPARVFQGVVRGGCPKEVRPRVGAARLRSKAKQTTKTERTETNDGQSRAAHAGDSSRPTPRLV
jgi:hypothetical protein